jgi:transcriptional regulator with PAS, ATPase and Fis domain
MRQYNQLRAQARDEDRIFTYDAMQPVYTIIFLETSSPNIPEETSAWEFDGSIQFIPALEMEFLFHTKYIALDKFKKMPQNIDSDKKQWVSLLAANTPEEIQNVAAMSEEFFDIIVEISEFVQDVGKVMDMFSEALYMLDRNTEELMYNEAMQELKETRKELEEQTKAMQKQQKAMQEQQKAMQEQQKVNEELKKQAIQVCIQMSPSKEEAYQNLYQRFRIEKEEADKYMEELDERN